MPALTLSTTVVVVICTPLLTSALPSTRPPTPNAQDDDLLPRQIGTPRPGLLTITALYAGDQCAGPEPWWYISTGTESWYGSLEKTNGCQPVNATWSIASAKAAWLAEGCKISFYTDKECKANGATPSLDQCVVSATQETWKSFAIRECVETTKPTPAQFD